jgi:hypothetical protein
LDHRDERRPLSQWVALKKFFYSDIPLPACLPACLDKIALLVEYQR